MILLQIIVFTLGSLQFPSLATGFVSKKLPDVVGNKYSVYMSNKDISSDVAETGSAASPCPRPSELPGDPSLLLVTNLNLGDKKLDVMKKCSKAISEATGKPEAYIGVSITDNASVLFGYVQCIRSFVGCHNVFMGVRKISF